MKPLSNREFSRCTGTSFLEGIVLLLASCTFVCFGLDLHVDEVKRTENGLEISVAVVNNSEKELIYNSPLTSHGFQVVSFVFVDNFGGETIVKREFVETTGGIQFSRIAPKSRVVEKFHVDQDNWFILPGFHGIGDATKFYVWYNSPKMEYDGMWFGSVKSTVVELDCAIREVFRSQF